MPKGVTTQNDILKLILRQTSPGWIANPNGFLALHTADPSAGDQTTNEVSAVLYVSYARTPITRDTDGWDITNNVAQNHAEIQCPTCTGGAGTTVSHVSYGSLVSGAGQIYYCGQLSQSLAVSNLIRPQFSAGGLVITEG